MDDPRQADRDRLWSLIGNEHVAVLVTVTADGSLDSRPMGCVQKTFDGTLWFMTFADTAKLSEIVHNRNVLVSYAQPTDYEFVSVSGRARIVDDHARIRQLWTEALRVWFPDGPSSPSIALIAIDVDMAKVWGEPASTLTYAYHYLKARVTGQSPTPQQVANLETIRF
jgi:general stress protein 26